MLSVKSCIMKNMKTSALIALCLEEEFLFVKLMTIEFDCVFNVQLFISVNTRIKPLMRCYPLQ